MSTKNYVSLSKLTVFLNNLKNTFALKNHSHPVDSALSDTSTNPVQNKVIDAEFDAIAEGMNALELAIDGKAKSDHNHDGRYYTESEIDSKFTAVNTSIGNITSGSTTVSKAETAAEATHAVSSDTATTATSATKATQDGNGKVISSTYETKTDATAKLTEAKSYADTAATKVKNDLLNGAGAAYDTLKELGELIDDNQDAISALETVAAGKADSDHTHDWVVVSDTQPTSACLWFDIGVEPSVTMISFSYGIDTYQAEEGMTWEEWILSDYNTGGFNVNTTYNVVRDSEYNVIIYNGMEVYATDVIVDNAVYRYADGGEIGEI